MDIYIYAQHLSTTKNHKKNPGVLCPGLGLNGGVGMKAGRDQGPRKKGWVLNRNTWKYSFIYI